MQLPCLQSCDEGVQLKLKVQPRSSRNAIGQIENDALKIWVTAPPVDSAANKAVIKLLAKKFGHPKSRIEIIKGMASRNKVVLLKGMKIEQVEL